MALPFILGLVIGGGAVYAYSNRDELSKQVKAKSKDLKAGLKKGEEALSSVSSSLKTRAKRVGKNLKNAFGASQDSTPKRTRTKSTALKTTSAKSTKTTRTRKPRAKKAQEPTLNPSTTSAPNENL